MEGGKGKGQRTWRADNAAGAGHSGCLLPSKKKEGKRGIFKDVVSLAYGHKGCRRMWVVQE